MRIFQLNTFCGSGSTGRIAVDIANYAGMNGADTIIGFGTGSVPQDAEVYALRIGGKWGRKWHAAIRKLLDAEGYGSRRATRKLIAFLKEYQPDVIHMHNLHGCYVNLSMLFSFLRNAGIPVVWTLHDCWPFTGHCAYFDYANCALWQTQCHHCPQQHTYPVCIGLDGSKRNYRHKQKLFTSLDGLTLVAPCNWMKDKAAQSYMKDLPCNVIYNGVNLGEFFPREAMGLRAKYGITEMYIALAVASEWEERKGFALLDELAMELGRDYRLVVLGLSIDQMAALPTNILGLERTASTRELAQWYSVADCLVNPTLEDNMPLVNLEALACGTPVAVFNTGGCPECLTQEYGRVVEQHNVKALAEAVHELAPHKHDLSAACMQQAEQFDSLLCAQRYWDLYQEVVKP